MLSTLNSILSTIAIKTTSFLRMTTLLVLGPASAILPFVVPGAYFPAQILLATTGALELLVVLFFIFKHDDRKLCSFPT